MTKILKNYRLSPYYLECIEKLVGTGYFSSQTEVIEVAVLKLFEKFEQNGKLERTPNKQHREIEEENS
ncbi:hypothetical protein [Methermicoccus shengliensis]|uniref:Uncharacterized protein n=1 Tax=Methermicoccus shengliensis TaxID=660064 RepID=A0A832RXB5_9EURY|nr:MAG: hypothetical protein XD46_1221 [Euryarchaeota archaeon 55_53]KUK29527.1 MAG: hypothetical protein XD62_1385 [Methanosarcinales archeaon 56_1174]MDI3488607.1 hypothetical protein [Methanosarcinales archaeon]HIH69923.1 hypothetical protein [Methermicoccus shengliensis]